VRLNKYQVVGVTILCLLVAGVSWAQFGKLKSLAKDKLGVQTQQSQGPETAAPVATNDPVTEEESEVRATYAPGVQKSLDVWRKKGPTPEVRGGDMEDGRKQDVVVTVSNVDARLFDAVRAYKPCNKIESFQILSATKVKLTIDLTGGTSGENCSLSFRQGGRIIAYADINVLDRETAKQNHMVNAMQSESQLPYEQQVALGKKRIGKVWTVKFANGRTERWTLVGPVPDSDISYRFKSASGKIMEILYSVGTATIKTGECTMQAPIRDNSAEGVAMDGCDVPLGTKFTALIQ
jgi:hypothetical protein